MNTNSIIGLLRMERKRRGLSIAALAAQMGIAFATLGSWERCVDGRNYRRPSLEQVERWAAALDMTLALVPMSRFDGSVIAQAAAAVDTLSRLAPTLRTLADVTTYQKEAA